MLMGRKLHVIVVVYMLSALVFLTGLYTGMIKSSAAETLNSTERNAAVLAFEKVKEDYGYECYHIYRGSYGIDLECFHLPKYYSPNQNGKIVLDTPGYIRLRLTNHTYFWSFDKVAGSTSEESFQVQLIDYANFPEKVMYSNYELKSIQGGICFESNPLPGTETVETSSPEPDATPSPVPEGTPSPEPDASLSPSPSPTAAPSSSPTPLPEESEAPPDGGGGTPMARKFIKNVFKNAGEMLPCGIECMAVLISMLSIPVIINKFIRG